MRLKRAYKKKIDFKRFEMFEKGEKTAKISLLEANLDLLEWLPNIINPFYSRTKERNQVLNVEYYPYLQPIRTNPNSLERILAELLNNACKYTPNRGEIFLKIHYRSVSNWLELTSTAKNKRKTKKQNLSLPSPSISDP